MDGVELTFVSSLGDGVSDFVLVGEETALVEAVGDVCFKALSLADELLGVCMVTRSPVETAVFVFELEVTVLVATLGLVLSLAVELLGEDMLTRFALGVDEWDVEDAVLEVETVLLLELEVVELFAVLR